MYDDNGYWTNDHDVMSVRKARPRKPATAATIDVDLWFEDVAALWQFAGVPFGPKAQTITDRTWLVVEATEDEGVTATFRFTHTCRNGGAHDGDTRRFVTTTAKAAGLTRDQLDIVGVRLVSRDANVPQRDLHVIDAKEASGYYCR